MHRKLLSAVLPVVAVAALAGCNTPAEEAEVRSMVATTEAPATTVEAPAPTTTAVPVTVLETTTTTTAPAATTTAVFSDAEAADIAFRVIVDGTEIGYSDALELATSACTALDNGVPMTTIVVLAAQTATEYRFTGKQTSDFARVLGAGISAYCPEYADQLG